MGGANSNFQILIWAFQTIFRRWIASPGRAGRQPPPPFSYKKAKGGCSQGPRFPWLCISAVLGEKNCFREENPSRGASVTLPRDFRKQICESFPPFFIRSSFVLRSSIGKFSNPRFLIHCFLAFIFI